jgi:hypothetical protein
MPRCLDKRKFQEYFLCNFRESNENNSNSNGISNGHKEEKKVTKKDWSPASPTKDAITNGISGSENEVKKSRCFIYVVCKSINVS